VGIAPEARDHLFEPFFTTKLAGSGTGLGLSTVYGIVEQHRGTISVSSEPGRGTSFQIDLPMTEQPRVKEHEEREEPVRGGTETLLVAEDFENVRRIVVTLLEGAGYRVFTAAHGDEALARLNEQGGEIDLALLDVVMPLRSGPEVATLAARAHPGLRVLFTSGFTDTPASLAAIPEGRLLRKPYVRDDLLRRVRRALDEPAETPPASPTAGPAAQTA
jgi:CheY-like chemotaxis protein